MTSLRIRSTDFYSAFNSLLSSRPINLKEMQILSVFRYHLLPMQILLILRSLTYFKTIIYLSFRSFISRDKWHKLN